MNQLSSTAQVGILYPRCDVKLGSRAVAVQ